MNLGIFNLLPFPALDGGRLVFVVIEAIRGKPLKPSTEGIIHAVGMVILLAFMAVVLVSDIIKLM
jgi:regulator of sigma E protease